MSALQNFFPIRIQELVNEYKNKIYVLTRHERTKKILSSAFNAKETNNINGIKESLVIGVLPIDLIHEVTKNGNTFVYVGVDPVKFSKKFNVIYNPKTAEQMLDQVSDEEFIALLRFVIYRKVEMSEIPVSEFERIIKGKKVYYNGSPIFKQAIKELFNVSYTQTEDEAEIVLSPSEKRPFYHLKITERNLIINSTTEFAEALKAGKIKIFYVTADAIVL